MFIYLIYIVVNKPWGQLSLPLTKEGRHFIRTILGVYRIVIHPVNSFKATSNYFLPTQLTAGLIALKLVLALALALPWLPRRCTQLPSLPLQGTKKTLEEALIWSC